jgi:hypothetical protein
MRYEEVSTLADGALLVDSVARNKLYPNSWSTPTKDQLDRIKVGTDVKIAVETEHDGERFWCNVLFSSWCRLITSW